MCQARGDPRGSPGPCAAFSYVGLWNNGNGVGSGLVYTCNLHGTAASPQPAMNATCFNLTASEQKNKCSVATSGVIRSALPPPTPDCAAGKCVYYADGKDPAAAAALAAKADVTIVFVSTDSGEGMDRSTLSLGDETNTLIGELANATQRLVVFMVHPGAVLTPWRGDVASIVASFMPGQEYGNAAAEVLFGEDEDGLAVSPSARLPVTFPTKDNQVGFNQEQWPGVFGENGTGACVFKTHCDDPMDHNCLAQQNEQNCQYSNYSEALLVGYRWYHATQTAPAFAFGHGLTFSTFHYEALVVTQSLVSFRVMNSGSRPAAEVAQLYLTYPASAGEPPHQLKGFEKTRVLNPGEQLTVALVLAPRAFSIWDVEAHGWAVVAGNFVVAVGSSSQDTRLSGTIAI